MKPALLFLSLAAAGALAASPAAASVITIDIRAFTDGRDLLLLQGDTVQWHHLDFAAPGRIHQADGSGRNEPTIISTTLDGAPVLTDTLWYPDWPEPVPAEIRYPAFSSIFTGLSPAIPAESQKVTLTVVSGRDHLGILSLPSAANGYTLTLDFNDNPSGGAVWYEALVTIEPGVTPPPGVPEPGTWALLFAGFGTIGLALRGRDRCAPHPHALPPPSTGAGL